MKTAAKYQPIPCTRLDCSAIDDLNTILNALANASSHHQIHEAMDCLQKNQGADVLGQLFLPNYSSEKASYYAHSENLDRYTQAYLESNAIVIDTISSQIRHQCLPIAFGLDFQRKKATREEQILYSLLDSHEISCGIIVPVHTPSCFSIFKVAFSETDPDLKVRLPALATLSQLIATQMHDTICRINGMKSSEGEASLSSREKECLTWAAAGKVAWEIAETLGVAEATVIFHLENAKRKLQAKTLPQAVAHAIRSKLIIF
ncbi:helix-turn-helix transcriptional regulator [Candidatus Methylobacter oryzae]|uniref:HTH luxR-type domain-containing protein n=1 Tax=Candidatus Methylobacter oryzae TaxID=2497749 RepID=A0ABY3C9Y5_9GAMM|nr:LuxR C-terminal-related transcriptional regulator [Candidatus Methylobacter oryzae]TRW91232.1 hypothetical protein EKO24_017615 [Candidatus Methylobacter oryzae]